MFLNGLKTLCKKEKLLVMSNFSFSHSVFKRLVLQTRENQGLFGKGLKCVTYNLEVLGSSHAGSCLFLTHYQTKNLDSSKLKVFAEDIFKFDENGKKLSKQVENTLGKGEIARYKQFLLFSTVFSKGLFPRGTKRCHL